MRRRLLYVPGDIVFIRAVVIEAMPDLFQVRIEDFPNLSITTYVPASEIAKLDDIDGLKPTKSLPK